MTLPAFLLFQITDIGEEGLPAAGVITQDIMPDIILLSSR
jgi:hypothetical protein